MQFDLSVPLLTFSHYLCVFNVLIYLRWQFVVKLLSLITLYLINVVPKPIAGFDFRHDFYKFKLLHLFKTSRTKELLLRFFLIYSFVYLSNCLWIYFKFFICLVFGIQFTTKIQGSEELLLLFRKFKLQQCHT